MEISEKLSELEKALKLSWSDDTSVDPDVWRNRNQRGCPYKILQSIRKENSNRGFDPGYDAFIAHVNTDDANGSNL